MKRLEPNTQAFLLDNNVFISAIRDPTKQTDTLKLIMRLMEDTNIRLVGNDLLAEEMLRYAELLKSQTATLIVASLLSKTMIVKVSENYIKVCKSYLKTHNRADILHAATCLQTNSTLITNDKHFDAIRDEGVIRVWNITEAIGRLLKAKRSSR